jgi:hypothetical protein
MELGRGLKNPRCLRRDVAHYKVTYKMDPPGEFGDTLFIMKREISRYTPQSPHDWYLENKSDWVGKRVISIESVD